MRRRYEFFDWTGWFNAVLAATSLVGSIAAVPRLDAEEITPASGFFDSAFKVTLSAADSDAIVFYTTNGATPGTNNGVRYESPIPIGTTTLLRAVACRRHSDPVELGARTYLFTKDVPKQARGENPESWGSFESGSIPSHYGMAASIVGSPGGQQLVSEGLNELPSLSIITDLGNLFDAQSGIYTHPTHRGSGWERSASAELLPWRGQPGFRINCGLRIHGGSSRRPEESPKHSLRLVFTRKYGQEKLRFPLFGSTGRQSFDTLVLRAGNNNSWLHLDARERRRADYIRDEWMRESMLAMGYPAARGRFVHLYLNGLYWGIYDLCERPDISFLAAGEKWSPQDYDFRKGQAILSGDRVAWDKMMSLANSDLSNNQNYSALQQCLDVTEFADYYLLNLYAGNSDWDRDSNWYAGRRRTPEGKFRFFVWDSERVLEGIDTDITNHDDDESPLRIFHQLSENADFRLLFTKRVNLLLLDNGALAPGPAADRYQALARTLEKAIVAESARWGGYRRDVHPYKIGPYEQYTYEEHWRPEVARITTEFFPRRTDRVLHQLREKGLYPETAAPSNGSQRGHD